MEVKFKVGDVVVESDINVTMFKMTIEEIKVSSEVIQYKCVFFEIGKLYRQWFREEQLLFEEDFIQKRISEHRNYNINKIIREV